MIISRLPPITIIGSMEHLSTGPKARREHGGRPSVKRLTAMLTAMGALDSTWCWSTAVKCVQTTFDSGQQWRTASRLDLLPATVLLRCWVQ
jgi:hypothetical protein